jgi:hypothetical protein
MEKWPWTGNSADQGLKNVLVCSSVMIENFKLTSRKFSRAVSVQFSVSHFSFLRLIRKLTIFGISE